MRGSPTIASLYLRYGLDSGGWRRRASSTRSCFEAAGDAPPEVFAGSSYCRRTRRCSRARTGPPASRVERLEGNVGYLAFRVLSRRPPEGRRRLGDERPRGHRRPRRRPKCPETAAAVPCSSYFFPPTAGNDVALRPADDRTDHEYTLAGKRVGRPSYIVTSTATGSARGPSRTRSRSTAGRPSSASAWPEPDTTTSRCPPATFTASSPSRGRST